LPEVVGEAALLIDPYDETAIAQAIWQIARDTSLQQRLQQAGIEQAKHLPGTQQRKKHWQFIEQPLTQNSYLKRQSNISSQTSPCDLCGATKAPLLLEDAPASTARWCVARDVDCSISRCQKAPRQPAPQQQPEEVPCIILSEVIWLRLR